ncbi:MAG: hypothetical protein GXO18_00935 [Aquificae bacterium]|nr:hypothetical protein [Aquificota bacterium]
MEETLEHLKQALKDLCKVYGIEDLSHLRYRTIAINEVEIKKETRAGIKAYKRIQLKGYNAKTKTIASWSKGEEPRDLFRLVNLYRACRYLSKACDYLYGV